MKHFLRGTLVALCLLAACKKSDKPALAVIATTTPTSITSTSAQTGGTITNTGNSPISQSGICWAFHSNPTLGDSVINSNTTNASAFTVSLINLSANTVYYVRAFVTNGIGTSYGLVDSFTTAAGVPTVTTTAITNNAALAAQSGGNIINNGGASITASGICWSTSANPTVSNSKTVGSTGSGAFADTLSNLTLGATYYVRSYATNSFGTGYGANVTFVVSATGTVVDYDGNAYPTITIGNQTWMTENLRVTHYQNGDPIYNASNDANFQWYSTTQGAYVYVNSDTTKDTIMTYGLSYSNLAVNDNRNIAPAGWHVATRGDWELMEFNEGMAASDTLPNGTAKGTISPKLQVGGGSGLNLQLAGAYSSPQYTLFGQNGFFWTSTMRNSTYSWFIEISGPSSSNYSGVITTITFGETMSVRCVKD